ncbi:hypothetical protein QUF76_11370 [Desulfobacterales bacterium HSG16]|nr:hypothetical protein [Desulfobacterales bacterium HSG16]
MNEILTLLKPRLWSIKNRNIGEKKDRTWIKLLALGIMGALLWAIIFSVSLRMLGYLRGIPEVGDIIAIKLLSMLLITSLALLIFSSLLTSLTGMYLARDLHLVHSMPVSSRSIFISRWIDSTAESSWMVNIYVFPIFLAYGIAYGSPFYYYPLTIAAMIILSCIASSISAALVMTAVMIIPANRMKTIFVFFGLFLFLILYIAFRLLKPELLVDPDVFVNTLLYLKDLQTPASPFLPSTWAFDTIKGAMKGLLPEASLNLAILASFAAALFLFVAYVSGLFYFKGFSKTQTGSVRIFKEFSRIDSFFKFLPGPIRAFTLKEIKVFFRDQTQWSQLFLIAGLVIIYIYNFKVLPIERSPIRTFYLQNLLSFLNMGLALFVLTAITARFAYPAVSLEGDAWWLVKSAPIRLSHFLWIKFFIYFFPLLILTEILIIVTNLFLDVTPFMMILLTFTVLLMVPGVVSLGIGMGAAFADFKTENPAQAITSIGGILFMVLSAAYIILIIIIEAGPVYSLFMSDIRGQALGLFEWAWISSSFIIVFFLGILAIVLPMRYGQKGLSGD